MNADIATVTSVASNDRREWARGQGLESLASRRERRVRRLLLLTFCILRFTDVNGYEIIMLIR